jgi:hypothetical protein
MTAVGKVREIGVSPRVDGSCVTYIVVWPHDHFGSYANFGFHEVRCPDAARRRHSSLRLGTRGRRIRLIVSRLCCWLLRRTHTLGCCTPCSSATQIGSACGFRRPLLGIRALRSPGQSIPVGFWNAIRVTH